MTILLRVNCWRIIWNRKVMLLCWHRRELRPLRRHAGPDLTVTDVLMPGPGGLQTLFVLKNTPETSEIPAIVVSGINPRILDLMPAAAYLQKPVEKRKFVQTVRNCLNAALHKSI